MSSASSSAQRVTCPWGWYETVCEQPGSLVKRIGVFPGQRISLQKHRHRSEHWVVVLGNALVTVGDREFELTVGGHAEINCGQPHRLTNRGSGPLEIVEVQLGERLDEDDIVRLHDDYGRT